MNTMYQAQNEEALTVGKAISNLEFVETIAMVLEASTLISGERAAELMAMITHLLKCRKICEKHLFMREILDN